MAACSLSASVAMQPPSRSTGGGIKTVNTSGHAATPRRTVTGPMQRRLAAEAPATYYEVPFMHTLGKATEQKPNTDLYLPFDGNADGKGWKVGGFSTYSACLGPAAGQEADDDWMISPAVHLKAGTEYIATFTEGVNTPDGVKAGVLALYLGETQTVEAMTRELDAAHEVTVKTNTREVTFTVEADGYYHFGFHCTTTFAKTGILTLRDFGVEESAARVVPPAAGTLSYVLAPEGALAASVTYTAPTLDTAGDPLQTISKVEVKTNWVVTNTFENVTPGEVLTFDVELYNNNYNKIEATAYVADTPGETAVIQDFYAGPDNPLPPTGLDIKLSDDYKHVTLSWEPVGETGESGGYVDTSKVTYYIFDAFGSYYDPAIASTTETSITLDYSDYTEQDFVAFQVTAGIDEMWYSLAATSDIVIVGDPEILPFTESFANARYEQAWAIDPESTTESVMVGTLYDNELQTNAADETAEPEYINSQDGDNGFFFIMPMQKDAVYGFFSTKIDISGAANPVFEFYYQGQGSALDAMVAADGGAFESARTIDLQAEPTTGWTLCRVDLKPYLSARYIQVELRLRAIHNDDEHTWSVPVDRLRVRDLVDIDLRLLSLDGPAALKAGETAQLTARIENLGTTGCTGARALLYTDGGEAVEYPLESIEADGILTVPFSISATAADGDSHRYRLELVAEGDAAPHNNTAETEVAIAHSTLPTVRELTASAADGEVTISWVEPDLSEATAIRTVAEDFESSAYTPLTISDFGEWSFVDIDGLKTYNIMQETANPYQTQPQAFQLYEPVLAGVSEEKLIDCQPHGGDRMLVAWSAQGQNDNWLISPELSGNAQTVRFWAKSFTSYIPESFEVYYSTGGKALDNFVKLATVGNYPEDNAVPEVWTEFTAELPDGARYFAIRHTANDSYALYVDDITYEAAPELSPGTRIIGYNLYRDNALISTSLTETTTTDKPTTEGTYSYRVSALYDCGESRACEAVEIIFVPEGINDILSGDGLQIGTEPGVIVINGARGLRVSVHTADGRAIYSGIGSDTMRIPAGHGVHIVTAGPATAKIIL